MAPFEALYGGNVEHLCFGIKLVRVKYLDMMFLEMQRNKCGKYGTT